jgi:uncharacterized membrane protein
MSNGSDIADSSAAEETQAELSDPLTRNIADILEFEQRETDALSPAQRHLEEISRRVARPGYLLLVLLLVTGWIVLNVLGRRLGIAPFDPPPFQWLQGLLALIALLTATSVLIAQRRQAKQSEQRAHLDLQINLLTEQKVTKLIHLVEELRRQASADPAQHDPHVAELKKPTDAAQVLSALKDSGGQG